MTCQTSVSGAFSAGNSTVRISGAPRRAVGGKDLAMTAEPGGMMTAAGEGPVAGDAIAALDRDRAPAGARAPGEHGARIAPEDRHRRLGRQIGRDHGGDRGL